MRGVSRVSCDPRRRACLPAPSKSSPLRPSVFQAGHIPSCGGSWECYALSPVAGACCWSLLLLSPLLSTRRRPSCSKPTRTLQGMARVRSGQAPAWPLVSVRSVRRGSRVKRDFACTLARAFPPALVVLRAQSRLGLEGRARTLSGPSPDLTSSVSGLLDNLAYVRQARLRCLRCCPGVAVITLSRPPHGYAAGTFAAPEAALWVCGLCRWPCFYRALPGVDDHHDYSVLRSRNDRTSASGGGHFRGCALNQRGGLAWHRPDVEWAPPGRWGSWASIDGAAAIRTCSAGVSSEG